MEPFAEVVESSLHSWKAQCWQWDVVPVYGSILVVKTPKRKIFGLVHEIETGSLDSSRTVFAYKKTEEQLRRDLPHIFEFLHTTFSCLTLGYLENNQAIYQFAPEPPKIHEFVSAPTDEDMRTFFSDAHYLHTLFVHAQQTFSLDDALLALLKHLSQIDLLTEDRMAHFIETYSLLTANDYHRLKVFLQRIQRELKF